MDLPASTGASIKGFFPYAVDLSLFTRTPVADPDKPTGMQTYTYDQRQKSTRRKEGILKIKLTRPLIFNERQKKTTTLDIFN